MVNIQRNDSELAWRPPHLRNEVDITRRERNYVGGARITSKFHERCIEQVLCHS